MQDASKTRRKCLRHPGTALERARKLVYYKLPKRPIDLVIHLSHALLTPPASAPNQKAEKGDCLPGTWKWQNPRGRKGKGKLYPTPGHSRPLTTAGDNGGDGYDENEGDEDANAIPAMEDQDQALAAMAGYKSTEGDAKCDDSVQSRRAVRVPKKTTTESTSTSTAAPSKGKKKRGSSSRAEELGDSEEAQSGPKKKKARLARSSEEILPAREEDGVTSMNDGD